MDLNNKPEIMDLFLTKLESVSKQFIGDTQFLKELSLLKRPILFSWFFCFST